MQGWFVFVLLWIHCQLVVFAHAERLVSGNNNNNIINNNKIEEKESDWWDPGLYPTTGLQWNTITTNNEWPKFPDGGRSGHAAVVLHDDDSSSSSSSRSATTIVVIGGFHDTEQWADSVLLLDTTNSSSTLSQQQQHKQQQHKQQQQDLRQWKNGPRLNEKRDDVAAVVCNGFVYAIGGQNHFETLDTMERIKVSDLQEWSTLLSSNNNNNHQMPVLSNKWTTLDVRLSSKRRACSAVVVHNHFIVILGGYAAATSSVSTVDILDTTTLTLSLGPHMLWPRSYFGATVTDDQQIWALGGLDAHGHELQSVETIPFQQPKEQEEKVTNHHHHQGGGHNDSSLSFSSSSSWLFASSQWTERKDLELDHGRFRHAVTCLNGSHVIVAGGYESGWRGNGKSSAAVLSSMVHVLDLQQGVIWRLPNLTEPRHGLSLVLVMMVVGGVTKSTARMLHDKQQLLALGGANRWKRLDSVEFLTILGAGLLRYERDVCGCVLPPPPPPPWEVS